MTRRPSRRPRSAPPPKARYRGGGAPAGDEPASAEQRPADATALAREVARGWRTRERLALAGLLLTSAVLAVVELLFLPLRFDGYLLPDLGGFPLPLTPVLAAATMPWLVSAAGRLAPRLAVASSPLVVWLLCIGVFGLAGPGGDRVLIEDWRSLLLLAGGTLPAAYKLGNLRG